MANRKVSKKTSKKIKFEFSHQELIDLCRAIKWGIGTQKGNKELKEWAERCGKIADMFFDNWYEGLDT